MRKLVEGGSNFRSAVDAPQVGVASHRRAAAPADQAFR